MRHFLEIMSKYFKIMRNYSEIVEGTQKENTVGVFLIRAKMTASWHVPWWLSEAGR